MLKVNKLFFNSLYSTFVSDFFITLSYCIQHEVIAMNVETA